ncbi:hypothetical protein TNCV_319841 [Trichonephila clavipes]|nr:hypothetical protein TNCV_319841 [Trichonephila clavipes]
MCESQCNPPGESLTSIRTFSHSPNVLGRSTDRIDDATHVPFPLSKKRWPNNPSIEVGLPTDPSGPPPPALLRDGCGRPRDPPSSHSKEENCSLSAGASNNKSPLLKECFEGVLIRVPLRTSYASDFYAHLPKTFTAFNFFPPWLTFIQPW